MFSQIWVACCKGRRDVRQVTVDVCAHAQDRVECDRGLLPVGGCERNLPCRRRASCRMHRSAAGETCVVEQSKLVGHASGHFEISEGKQCGGGTGTRGQRCHVSATTVARQLASQRCQARRCHPRPQSPQTYVTGVSPNGGNSIEQGLRKPEPFGNAEVLVNCRGAEPVLVRDKAPSKTRRSVQLPNY